MDQKVGIEKLCLVPKVSGNPGGPAPNLAFCVRNQTLTPGFEWHYNAPMPGAQPEPPSPKVIRHRLQAIYERITRSDAATLWDEAATLVETLPPGSRARRKVQWLMDAIKEKAKALR